MTTNHVPMLLALATMPDAALKAELHEAQWAHYGRRVHDNINHDNFLRAFNLASMKAENTAKLVDLMRIYLLTGALP